ncbi:SH3 domain signaling protein [Massariosphaeria phaeospora]|uniref:SH3 domain signaling protein n=1 Tax=Massariosphaeria phaeospora TaxID=100035 RepID=A0A7C8MEV6_9PLEO|nr:SH3 domain signaling protein [Massariosphaeria phaeospora]
MQRMQRKFGRFLPRTPNEADVESMLTDFTDSDQMLEKIEEAAKQWRDAWTNILNHQLTTVENMLAIYKPLGAKAAGEGGNRVHDDTPPETMERCTKLVEAFSELKTDMMEEVKDIDRKLIIPAKLARDSLKPMKKALKKREDKKVDYERYKSRAETLQNKKTRSDRDNIALTKHEGDLARASHEYEYADEALRSLLPKLNAATFSLLPHLLANQIVLQNNLIGNLYTVLNQYSHEQGYPDPPPEPEEVIPLWDGVFTPLRKEIEAGFEVLKSGKAIHMPMRLPDKGETLTGLGLRNKVMPGRRPTTEAVPTAAGGKSPRPGYGLPPPAENGPPMSLSNKPSMSSLNASKPKVGGHSPGLSPSSVAEPWGRRTSTASYASSNATNGHDDYFGKQRVTSNSMSPNPAAGKKKPPPPPPKKVGSFHSEYVTAMYDFEGQGEGDLSFREGDRIRVVKKTNSSQDWWEGELRGSQGTFPANYCK